MTEYRTRQGQAQKIQNYSKMGHIFHSVLSLCSKETYVSIHIPFQKSKRCIFNEFHDPFRRVLFFVDFPCDVVIYIKFPMGPCNYSSFLLPYKTNESTGSVTVSLDQTKTSVHKSSPYKSKFICFQCQFEDVRCKCVCPADPATNATKVNASVVNILAPQW